MRQPNLRIPPPRHEPERHDRRGAVAALIGVLALSLGAVMADPNPQEIDARAAPVSPEALASHIATIAVDPAISDGLRQRLITRYREAERALRESATLRQRAADFLEAARTAPEKTRHLREELAATRATRTDPARTAEAEFPPETPPARIAERLARERAARQAAQAEAARIDREREHLRLRPLLIEQRMGKLEQQRTGISATLRALATEGAGPVDASETQAKLWALETQYLAIDAELRALNAEIQALPGQADWLDAHAERAALAVAAAEARVSAFTALLTARRRIEAEHWRSATAALATSASGGPPELVALAEQNMADALDLLNRVDRINALEQDAVLLTATADRLKDSFARLARTRAKGGLTPMLGSYLWWHPIWSEETLAALSKRGYAERIAEATVAQAQVLEEQARSVNDPGFLARDAHEDPEVQTLFAALLAQREAVLARRLVLGERELEVLDTLLLAQGRLQTSRRELNNFIAANLFWLRTHDPISFAKLATLMEEIGELLDPAPWAALAEAVRDGFKASGLAMVSWSLLILALALRLARPALLGGLHRLAARARHVATERFANPAAALAISLALAAPWPLMVLALGMQFQAWSEGGGALLTFAEPLMWFSSSLYLLLLARTLCLPDGLASAHFRWSPASVSQLCRELRWLAWTWIPLRLAWLPCRGLLPLHAVTNRLVWIALMLVLALFFARLLHPRRGILAHRPGLRPAGLLARSQLLWYPALIGVLLLLPILSWSGHLYTAITLNNAYIPTIMLLFGLVLARGLALNWLHLAARRLARKAARERLAAASASAGETEDTPGETLGAQPEDHAQLDLSAISQSARELLGFALIVIGAVGLYRIWVAVWPALAILDNIVLWHYTHVVDGESVQASVGLADLGHALFYLVLAVMLSRRLPTLLDLVLAEQFRISSSQRYTVVTLTNYAILVLALTLALGELGAQWRQLQWLVAAFSLGIGFGLQEIVANFVSGLIILFEQPVRVGDIVTVGDTDGMVTRIQIRATTIRGYDRKELLVPNKEFITGRLLNWSLSDPVTRIMVVAGVRYGTDIDRAHALMREAAVEHPRVLEDPAPVLTFEAFGEHSLTLILRAYIDELDKRLATITDLHRAIHAKFLAEGIEIAPPRRTLRLEQPEALRVRLES